MAEGEEIIVLNTHSYTRTPLQKNEGMFEWLQMPESVIKKKIGREKDVPAEIVSKRVFGMNIDIFLITEQEDCSFLRQGAVVLAWGLHHHHVVRKVFQQTALCGSRAQT